LFTSESEIWTSTGNGVSKEERKEAEQEKCDNIPKKALQNGLVQRMFERVHEIQDAEQVSV
jgi:hypothetical protein